jgi:hypothetical protein
MQERLGSGLVVAPSAARQKAGENKSFFREGGSVMQSAYRLAALGIALALGAAVGWAQEFPKPGPEHAHLKELEGTWDATVKFMGGESKGVMTYKMELGGLWLVSDFQGDFGGMKFQGKGLETYDPAKKKYVSIWVDSMETYPMISEGTFDKERKVLTMTGQGPGMDGKMTTYKSVVEMKDKDMMVFTMSTPGKDGKDQVIMTITYKRRK